MNHLYASKNVVSHITTLFYDWGNYENVQTATILDTTFRDGFQSLLLRYPSLDEKLNLIDMLIDLGIEAFDIGFPVSNPKHKYQTSKIAEHIHKRNPDIRLTCISRTKIEDVQAIIDVSLTSGAEIEPLIFVGSSPARLMVENWNIQDLSRWIAQTVDFAVTQGLRVNFACEDATRSDPATLKSLYSVALDSGASRFTIADTVGICNPISTAKIIKFIRDETIKNHGLGLEWHGHNDRGLSIANALSAISEGADCVHTTVFGVGERTGNTPMEPLLLNLHYLTDQNYDLSLLPVLSQYASVIFGESIPPRYPVIGKYAFSTAAGIHASAILKACKLGCPDFVANIYAGIDPKLVNRTPEIQIGPLSGTSNVVWKTKQLDLDCPQELTERILEVAREHDSVLSDSEIISIVTSE